MYPIIDHDHTAEALSQLARDLTELQPHRVIVAASGGLETPLVAELGAAVSPAVVVNCSRPTDPPLVAAQLEAHRNMLKEQVAELARAIAQPVQSNPHWQNRSRLLHSILGVGPVLTSTLIAQLPELGQANHKEIAALAGVAPYNRDSGRWRSRRTVLGGRGQLRAALYMATLVATRCNPVIRDCYQRLCAAGKARKVPLTACMRKLVTICNAIVKTGLPRNPPPASQP